MSITVNTKVYSLDSTQTPDRNRYTGPSHTLSAKDYFDLSRVSPKATSDFSGVARSSVKITRTVALTGALSSSGTAIAEASFSTPVGMAEVDVDSLRDDLGDLLLLPSIDDLVYKHDINH